MEAPHPTAGWEKVGDRFYRKTQLYTAVFDRDLDLDNYIVAGAPYGGAVGKFAFLHLGSSRFISCHSVIFLGLQVACLVSQLKWTFDAPSTLQSKQAFGAMAPRRSHARTEVEP